MKINFKFLSSLMVLMLSMNVSAGLGTWTSSGPEGGRIYDLVADPITPNVYYAATRGGVYKSNNGAATWNRINNGISVSFISSIVHHKSLADVVYVAGVSSVFKSTDGGLNWNNSSTGLPTNDNINNLSMAVLNPDILYLSTLVNGVYKTINGGNTWFPANTGLPARIYTVRVSPTDNNHVFAATENGLFDSSDGGNSWTNISAGIGAPYTLGNAVTNIQFAGFAGELYLSTFTGIYKSIDNAVSWSHQPSPIGDKINVNPSNSNEVIVSGSVGIWTTTNGGDNWSHTLTDFAGNANEVAQSNALIYDPFNPTKKLAGTDSNGIYVKTSASPTWLQSSSGMNAQTIRGLAIHPGLSNRIYAGVGDVFSPAHVNFISTNSGATWSQSNTGLTGLNFRDIEVDPFTASTVSSTVVYAVGRDVPVTTFTGILSDADGGIYKSTDGGSNWFTIDSGIPLSSSSPTTSLFSTVRDITIDLNSSLAGAPSQTLYVAGTGRFSSDGIGGFTKIAARIYKSTDAGANWNSSDSGIAEPTTSQFLYPAAVKIVIDPSDSNTLYAATFLVGYDSTVPAPTIGNGIWKSIDAGVSWTLSSTGIPTIGGSGTSPLNVLSLVIDPVASNRLYASVHNPDSFSSQIYKSVDSGVSWTLANTGIATSDVRDIAIDSAGIVYAAAAGNAGNPGGVYQSKDFGATWQSFSIGLDALVNVLQIRIDESGINPILYAGTTQSVHSIELLPDGDSDGVSDTTELAAPNAGDANNDGMADSNQNNVSSLPIVAINNKLASNKGISDYVTIEVTPISGSCANLEDVQALTGIDVPADAHRSFDYGILRFDIVDCNQATVKIIYHGATNFNDPNWAIRIYAPQISGTTEFQWQTYDASVTGNSWTFTLSDGQFGDIRPNNGRILFQGAVGLFAESIFQNGFE
jgi:photosystem II stability/assembly factor-like uncharacterized protein